MRKFRVFISIKVFIKVVLCFWFTGCEEDDICVGETPTPGIVIQLVDKGDRETPKVPENFSVRAVGIDQTLEIASTSSITIPLNVNREFTQFEFITNHEEEDENIDIIQINYTRQDKYISRACGYKAIFSLKLPFVLINEDGNNWIEGFNLRESIIADENQVHLFLFH